MQHKHTQGVATRLKNFRRVTKLIGLWRGLAFCRPAEPSLRGTFRPLTDFRDLSFRYAYRWHYHEENGMTEPEAMMFEPSDWVPNHPSFPVLLYTSVVEGEDSGRALAFEEQFSQNGWQDVWHNGIFPFPHYHSQAHEVLGIAKGHARLLIGGSTGKIIEAKAGDCLVLPAGTGHMRLEATADFLVIGAYPPGQEADILKEAPSQEQMNSIATLPRPETDPLFGPDGPLRALWR